MKNFSEIKDSLKTSKDSLIESFTEESGLPKELVTKLYENEYMFGGGSSNPNNNSDINEKFKSLLKTGFTNFDDSLETLLNIFKTATKDKISSLILNLLSSTAESNSMSFLKIVIYILFVKDKGNFSRVASELNVDNKLANIMRGKLYTDEPLFESLGINPKLDNDVNDVPTILGLNDSCDLKADIQFYTDLKTILARNNQRWGANYHLNNAYGKICEYIDSEIEYLQNKDNIQTVDANFEKELFNQLFNNTLNVMYRDANVLKTLVSDMQTLNFDLMCFIYIYVRNNQKYCNYVSRKTYEEFIVAFKNLYSKISSSRKVSKLLLPYKEPPTESCGQGEPLCSYGEGDFDAAERITLDGNVYNFQFDQPIKTVSVVDAIYIMKACVPDFNLTIRPHINHFLTKAIELVGKIDKVMLEATKINMYK